MGALESKIMLSEAGSLRCIGGPINNQPENIIVVATLENVGSPARRVNGKNGEFYCTWSFSGEKYIKQNKENQYGIGEASQS